MHAFIETQKEWLRTDLPPFRAGDTLRVNVRVKEGEKERLQAFEGVCIAKRGSGVSETFTEQLLCAAYVVPAAQLPPVAIVKSGEVAPASSMTKLPGVTLALNPKRIVEEVEAAAPARAVPSSAELSFTESITCDPLALYVGTYRMPLA